MPSAGVAIWLKAPVERSMELLFVQVGQASAIKTVTCLLLFVFVIKTFFPHWLDTLLRSPYRSPSKKPSVNAYSGNRSKYMRTDRSNQVAIFMIVATSASVVVLIVKGGTLNGGNVSVTK